MVGRLQSPGRKGCSVGHAAHVRVALVACYEGWLARKQLLLGESSRAAGPGKNKKLAVNALGESTK